MEDTLNDRPSVAEAMGIARLSPLLTRDLGRLIGSNGVGATFATLDERAIIQVTTCLNEARWVTWLSRCEDPIIRKSLPWCNEPMIIDGVGKVMAYRREFLLPLRSDQKALLAGLWSMKLWEKASKDLDEAVLHLRCGYGIAVFCDKIENFGTRADGSLVLSDCKAQFLRGETLER
jgi:hypothetical protein